jgi:NADH-quinone oxidoreductase subunit C
MEAKDLIQRIEARFGPSVLSSHSRFGDATVVVGSGTLVELCRFVRDDPELRFNFFVDLTVVDQLQLAKSPRFELVVHLRSLATAQVLRVKVPVEEQSPSVPSLVEIYPAANWFEREAFDMFGLRFEGHPDLRRILMYEEFEGHPLRKDYPVQRQQPLVPQRESWTPGVPWKPEERWDQYAGDRRESPA